MNIGTISIILWPSEADMSNILYILCVKMAAILKSKMAAKRMVRFCVSIKIWNQHTLKPLCGKFRDFCQKCTPISPICPTIGLLLSYSENKIEKKM